MGKCFRYGKEDSVFDRGDRKYGMGRLSGAAREGRQVCRQAACPSEREEQEEARSVHERPVGGDCLGRPHELRRRAARRDRRRLCPSCRWHGVSRCGLFPGEDTESQCHVIRERSAGSAGAA